MLIIEDNCYNFGYKNAILCFYVRENVKSKDNNSKFRFKCINQEKLGNLLGWLRKLHLLRFTVKIHFKENVYLKRR